MDRRVKRRIVGEETQGLSPVVWDAFMDLHVACVKCTIRELEKQFNSLLFTRRRKERRRIHDKLRAARVELVALTLAKDP